jgi:hypothetical protein
MRHSHAIDQSITKEEKIAGVIIAAMIFLAIAAATLHH